MYTPKPWGHQKNFRFFGDLQNKNFVAKTAPYTQNFFFFFS